MSDVVWKIDGVELADFGLELVGGIFRTQGTSELRLRAARNFDVAPIFAYGETKTLQRVEGGITLTVFRGKVAPPAKYADPSSETHEYVLEDAWADLEKSIYQEPWAIGSGTFLLPKAILGLNASGVPITVGAQIAAIITYAASVGVDIQMGSHPGGETLWPKEIQDTSCSEAINACLEFHPDWISWVDHTTSPPTFNVTRPASMGDVTLATDGSGPLVDFDETNRQDLVPLAVRLIYELSASIDGEIYRDTYLDAFPATGVPVGGPRVLCATIPLAGAQMQIQKQRIRVRTMPTSGDTSDLAKKWVKANYPRLADVDLADFEIQGLVTELVPDPIIDAPHAPPVDPKAERLEVVTVADVPNQLLAGNIEDWMRKKVGDVRVSVTVVPNVAVSRATQEKINLYFPPITVTCTDAITKIYKGMSQWTAAEDVPAGIAQAVYESMQAAYNHQGSATFQIEEIMGTRYHGKKLTLTGAATANAPIHTVQWDIGTGMTTLGFGPVPELAPADFLELQRRLRARKVTWWSTAERSSNRLGAEEKPSARGDTVGGYDGPKTRVDSQPPRPVPFQPITIGVESTTASVTIHPGWIREVLTHVPSGTDAIRFIPIYFGEILLTAASPPIIEMASGDYLYVTYSTDKNGGVKATPTAQVQFGATVPATAHYSPDDDGGSGGVEGSYAVKIAQIFITGNAARWVPYIASDVVHYHEVWPGDNLGEGAGIWKKFDRDTGTQQFRGLKGNYGIIQDKLSDTVNLDFDGENRGGEAAVFMEEESAELPDGKVKFRTLRGLSSGEAADEEISQQIRVEVADSEESLPETIRIRGNGKKGSIQFLDSELNEVCLLQWEDGLVITEGEYIFQDTVFDDPGTG